MSDFMPREKGLLVGHRIAVGVARGELGVEGLSPGEALRTMASDPPSISTPLRDLIMDGDLRDQLGRSDDPDAESAFWGGFVTGVRAYLVEDAAGHGIN